jgi:beta-mannosidase
MLVKTVDLTGDWQFEVNSQTDSARWMQARVPGTIHTDLIRHNLIPDPYLACNEAEVQWVGREDWNYRNTFSVDKALMKQEHIELVFEGLDTYASVKLNGHQLFVANNMFRRWVVECKSMLRPGKNTLEVQFESAENRFLHDSTQLGYPLPGGRWVFARKAAYHFGWDWGPKLVTAGIWKPVYLRTWQKHLPEGVQLYTKKITDEEAIIEAEFHVRSVETGDAVLRVTDLRSGMELSSANVVLTKEQKKYSLSFSIKNPKRWWPNGLGKSHLYALEFTLETSRGEQYKQVINHGVRTVEVIAEADSIGESMYLKINGEPVFMKGANYIPQHNFLPELSRSDYAKVVQTAVKSNMNMLRVWGGGIYGSDAFYDVCDSAGILVWQDFMFACAMYPSDSAFVANVQQEAREQVLRLRNHPALAMWCGNNEVAEGWVNWQWQKTHAIQPADSATIWHGYQKIFREVLPAQVEKYDSERFYVHSSPLIGWGHEESMQRGSAHYWGVWWGMEPFEKYLEKVPRFMSEFGFQAMPALATWNEVLPEGQDTLFSSALRCHQKHKTGYQTIDTYLAREYLFPATLEDYIYQSQLLQAKGVGMAIENHRRNQPRCMGTLYWQLNDCWPVTSWSGMDVNGNWKALQYKVRDLFDNVMVSLIEHKGEIEVKLVSGVLHDISGRFVLDVVDFNGTEHELESAAITLSANSVRQMVSVDSHFYWNKKYEGNKLLRARFITEDGSVYVNQKFLSPMGKLQLPDADVTVLSRAVKGGYELTMRTSAFAAFVQLSLEHHHAWFDQNYFHLWPGSTRKVFCQTDLAPEEFNNQLQILHLQKSFSNSQKNSVLRTKYQ